MELWHENRLDGRWEITPEEIAAGFWKSSYGLTVRDGGGRLDRFLAGYIASPDGLNSSWDDQDGFNGAHDIALSTWPKAVDLDHDFDKVI